MLFQKLLQPIVVIDQGKKLTIWRKKKKWVVGAVLPALILQGRKKVLKSRVSSSLMPFKGEGFVYVFLQKSGANQIPHLPPVSNGSNAVF